MDGITPTGFPDDWLDRRTEHVADAVLAVLAGEQEQVEK